MRVEVESAGAAARWEPGGLSLWQEAEQEGGCEAVGLQESGLGLQAQPVPVAVQQHQGHATGPDKALLEEDGLWGKTPGAGPQVLLRVVGSPPRGPAPPAPGVPGSTSRAPPWDLTSTEEAEAQREEVMASYGPEAPWRNFILPSTTWLSTVADVILRTRG